MKQTDTAHVQLKSHKRTKIIATVGPSTDNYEAILELIKAGANGIRLNFSHGTVDERSKQIAWIRKASVALGKPVAIIQDLQGPKMRLGDFDGIFNVHKGQTIGFMHKSDFDQTGFLPTQYDISKKAKRGHNMYFYDGKIRTVIKSISDGVVYAEAQNDGILISRKSINLPDTDFEGDIITAKDRGDLLFGSAQAVDYVALSFVQTAKDVERLRHLLRAINSHAKVIAKIETKSAVEHIEEVVEAADAVMVARGDLAVETPAESVPIVQRKIVGLGQKYAKPTIVATQMLDSMTNAPDPTRAEVSDIATAVLIGADCLMLSDETASGRYPIESVATMKRIILYTEVNSPLKVSYLSSPEKQSRAQAICQAVVALAHSMSARAIVAETKSGATALQIASLRTSIPVIAVTSDEYVARQLAIVYCIKSYVRAVDPMAASSLTSWMHRHKILSKGDVVVLATGKHPGVVGTTDTIQVRVIE